ncbi:MAG: 2-C-methyl-D-erythritol 4-phosphate cytidylyltransferase [Planctomycetota bacterium]
MAITVIIPAAGASTRFNEAASGLLGGDGGGTVESGLGDVLSKLDADLGGRPLLQRAVELFVNRDDVAGVVVAGPADDAPFAAFSLRHADRLSMLGVKLVRGSNESRAATVQRALEAIDEDDRVAVHDAARPVTPVDLIDRVFAASEHHAAVIPAIAVDDTLKRVAAEAETDAPADPLAGILGGAAASPVRRVEGTIDRASLVRAQTPQVFRTEVLRRAYASGHAGATDDAELVQRLGESVVTVEGDAMNLKVTRPRDVELTRVIGGFARPKERASHKRF